MRLGILPDSLLRLDRAGASHFADNRSVRTNPISLILEPGGVATLPGYMHSQFLAERWRSSSLRKL